MSGSFRLHVVTILLTIASACGAQRKGASHENFVQGPLRGLEDIIRWTVEIANGEIFSRTRQAPFPQVSIAAHAGISNHPFLRGSFATDFPDRVSEFPLRNFYGADSRVDFTYDDRFQDLHFLRDFSVGGPDSAYDSCRKSKARIILTTQKIIADRMANANGYWPYFVGHALHTIEDSFSPAHTVRSKDFRQLYDICTYQTPVAGVCLHQTAELGLDSVWRSPLCLKSTWECLNPAAQTAALVGAGYLVKLNEMLQSAPQVSMQDIGGRLTSWFDQTGDFWSGYFNCDLLMGR